MSSPSTPTSFTPQARGLSRGAWLAVGFVLVGIGGVGAVVPVLPTTIFFIGAAACFARSSPRLERWVLGLPHVGPLVRDYRSGLGMPRRAKITASSTIAIAVTVSAMALASWPGRAVAAGLGLIGIAYVMLVVPTRERVLAERALASGSVVPVPMLGGPHLARGRRARRAAVTSAGEGEAGHDYHGQDEQRDHSPR